jgi:hypothetical protein
MRLRVRDYSGYIHVLPNGVVRINAESPKDVIGLLTANLKVCFAAYHDKTLGNIQADELERAQKLFMVKALEFAEHLLDRKLVGEVGKKISSSFKAKC